MLRSIKILLVVLCVLLIPSLSLAQVVINEVMYAPVTEPEWVELFNAGTIPVNLAGWQLHDATTARPTFPTLPLPPKTFVVATTDTTALRQARPGRYRMVQIALPTFNNSDDDITLRDPTDEIVESFHYQAMWGGGDEVSLERINPTNNPTLAASWGSCKGSTGATPGAKNSLAALEVNLTVVLATFIPATATVAAQIKNTGTLSAAGEAILFYRPGSGVKEELHRIVFDTIVPGQTNTVELQWNRTITEAGEVGVVEINVMEDEQSNDNHTEFTVRLPLLDTGVIITEVMNDPATINGLTTAEYVELFNPHDRPVKVDEWKLYDATAKPIATLPDTAHPLQPGSYVVIASDTSIYLTFPALKDSANVLIIGKQSFGLNLDAEQVVLRNARGATVDSIYYWSNWWGSDVDGTRGVSLERISLTGGSNQKENWSGSVDRLGGTPGRENSRSIPIKVSNATLAAVPETISPDGDGRDDFMRLSFQLPMSTSRIVLQVYDRLGRPMVQIANNEPAPPVGEITWNGYGEDQLPLPQGIYIIRLEAYDASEGAVATAQTTVVVAKKM